MGRVAATTSRAGTNHASCRPPSWLKTTPWPCRTLPLAETLTVSVLRTDKTCWRWEGTRLPVNFGLLSHTRVDIFTQERPCSSMWFTYTPQNHKKNTPSLKRRSGHTTHVSFAVEMRHQGAASSGRTYQEGPACLVRAGHSVSMSAQASPQTPSCQVHSCCCTSKPPSDSSRHKDQSHSTKAPKSNSNRSQVGPNASECRGLSSTQAMPSSSRRTVLSKTPDDWE